MMELACFQSNIKDFLPIVQYYQADHLFSQADFLGISSFSAST